jgi:hypothetical protein
MPSTTSSFRALHDSDLAIRPVPDPIRADGVRYKFVSKRVERWFADAFPNAVVFHSVE